MSKRLVDVAKIKVQAGNGGDGSASFRREKFIPKGGPDGGDGGRGGDVFIIGTHNMATLMDFRSRASYKATNGAPGGGRQMSGRAGENLYIKVPVGTLIYEYIDGEKVLVGDIVEHYEEGSSVVPFLIARGGRGGKGNIHFKSSTNRTPLQFTKGGRGDLKELELEIKLVADIGLIGFPNAGKSTLINNLTGTSAKTASYPFTTLIPNLGVLKVNDQTYIVADIPGLISGASEGKGLGDDFLRHVERTRVLIHIIDPLYNSSDQVEDSTPNTYIENAIRNYAEIRHELENYGANLTSKPEVVVINKIDVTEIKDVYASIEEAFKQQGVEVMGISAATGENLDALRQKVFIVLKNAPDRIIFNNDRPPLKVYTPDNLPNRRIVQ